MGKKSKELKVTKRSVYSTSDGRTFDTAKEAERHVAINNITRELFKSLNSVMDIDSAGLDAFAEALLDNRHNIIKVLSSIKDGKK
jgi:hypothetical protein